MLEVKGGDDESSEALHRLIQERKKGDKEWKSALRVLVTDRYASTIGSLNIETTTTAKLQECFREAGVSAGQMLGKSIRFYLKALEHSGATVSPHLKAQRTRSASRRNANGSTKTRTATKKKTVEKGAGNTREENDPLPSGFERLPIPGISGAYIQFPVDLTKAHCKLFEASVSLLNTVVEVREGGS